MLVLSAIYDQAAIEQALFLATLPDGKEVVFSGSVSLALGALQCWG